MPPDFADDVERARRKQERGMLRLYASEAAGFDWHADAIRLVTEAQRQLGAGFVANQNPPCKVVLFTGHMIDAPGKAAAAQRFPPTQKAEARARELISAAVARELGGDPSTLLGIAAGACGGDILFHEACAEHGIASALYLALPEDQFLLESVQRGGPDWIRRYRALTARLPTHVLQAGKDLPDWLAAVPDYDVWQRANLWMLHSALASGARELTLIALLNRERDPDGPGGTAHLLAQAAASGVRIAELDARPLLAAQG